MKKADFRLQNCFSLVILYPLTRSAEQWIEDNNWIENYLDGGRIEIEPQYFGAVAQEINNSNLTIEKL